MTCDEVRQLLLDLDSLDRASPGGRTTEEAEALKHVERCGSCQSAVTEYDRIRTELRPPEAISGVGAIEPPGGWGAFERRLAGSLEAPSARGRWLPWGAAIAASLLIGLTGYVVGRYGSDAPPVALDPDRGRVVTGPALDPEEVARQVYAFDQVSEVFERRTSWVLLANSDSNVGLSPEPVAATGRVLLLRLTMLHADEVVSSADLVIVPGQSANLRLPLSRGHSLKYLIGTSSGEPTQLSLWAELETPRGGEALAALATQLRLEPGEQVTVGQLATSAGPYELKVGFSQSALPGGGS